MKRLLIYITFVKMAVAMMFWEQVRPLLAEWMAWIVARLA